MSEDLRVLLAVGTRLAHDGRWWQVSELHGPHVLLPSEGSRTADPKIEPQLGAR